MRWAYCKDRKGIVQDGLDSHCKNLVKEQTTQSCNTHACPVDGPVWRRVCTKSCHLCINTIGTNALFTWNSHGNDLETNGYPNYKYVEWPQNPSDAVKFKASAKVRFIITDYSTTLLDSNRTYLVTHLKGRLRNTTTSYNINQEFVVNAGDELEFFNGGTSTFQGNREVTIEVLA